MDKKLYMGNKELEMKSIIDIDNINENIIYSISRGQTGFLTLVCC